MSCSPVPSLPSFPLCVCGMRNGGHGEALSPPTAAVVGRLLPTNTASHCVPPPSLSSPPPPPPSPLPVAGGTSCGCSLLLPRRHLRRARWRDRLCTPLFAFELLALSSPPSPVAGLIARLSNPSRPRWMREGPGQESSLGKEGCVEAAAGIQRGGSLLLLISCLCYSFGCCLCTLAT